MEHAFDTLKAARKLEDAGLNTGQAEGVALAIGDACDTGHEHLATKADMAEVRATLEHLATKAEMEKGLSAMHRTAWTATSIIIAALGLAVGLIKYLP